MIDEHKAGIAATNKGLGIDHSMQLICIEGNIGAGKSTLTEELASFMGAKAFFEPVGNNPYLERYYKDPKRFALEMQFWLMSRRFEMHEQAIRHIWQTGQTVIMDRSIYGDWVFAKKNWIDENIDHEGYEAYLHHRNVMSRYLLAPHVVLFLDVTPEMCLRRLTYRGRGCERTIPLPYLQGLHSLHEELAVEMKAAGSRVLRTNWETYGNAARVAEELGRT